MSIGQDDLSSPSRVGAAAFFDAVAAFYDRVYAPDGLAHRTRMAALLGHLAGHGGPEAASAGEGVGARTATELLVLGVGTGRELPTLLDAGFATFGVDCSQKMLDQCAKRARCGVLTRANFWGPLPFAAGAFGAAVALHGTLAHPPDRESPRGLALELSRVLRAGAPLVMEVPTLEWFQSCSAVPLTSEIPGVLTIRDGYAVFCDKRSGATIGGCVVGPLGWLESLAPYFTCNLHNISPDEIRIVGVRRSSP